MSLDVESDPSIYTQPQIIYYYKAIAKPQCRNDGFGRPPNRGRILVLKICATHSEHGRHHGGGGAKPLRFGVKLHKRTRGFPSENCAYLKPYDSGFYLGIELCDGNLSVP